LPIAGEPSLREVGDGVIRIYAREPLAIPLVSAALAALLGIVELLPGRGAATIFLGALADLAVMAFFSALLIGLAAPAGRGEAHPPMGELIRRSGGSLGQLVLAEALAGLVLGALLLVASVIPAAAGAGITTLAVRGASGLATVAAPIMWALALVGILLVVPALILATFWSLTAPVVVLERPGARRALRRSRELVEGHGVRVFWIMLLALGIVIATQAAAMPLESLGAAPALAARIALGAVFAPLPVLAAAVLYLRLGGVRVAAAGPGGGGSPPGAHGQG
jgi:hypothetical protein